MNRQALKIPARFADPSVRQSVTVDVQLIDCLDELIGDVELYLDRTVKVDDADTFYRLWSIPGVGKILALVLLYEIHDIRNCSRLLCGRVPSWLTEATGTFDPTLPILERIDDPRSLY
jgi:hypothetical protein